MLFKKMLRDIKENKMQFIAIFLMSFITLLAFAGIRSEVQGLQDNLNIIIMRLIWLMPMH